jgi:photosystem II stability/assembly factor-like uncharacterized protein
VRLALLLALTACASYRVLPPAPLSDGVQEIAVRYEKSRLLFFKSAGEGGAVARVFAEGGAALATVAAPEPGVFASSDGGRTWTFARGPFDFREVIFAAGHIYARTAASIWHSEDGGKSWASSSVVPSDDRLDAMALGKGGVLYTAGRSRLYLYADGAQTWKPLALPLPPQPAWRARSIVPDPLHPQTLYVSLRTEPQGDFLARFKALFDYSSDEALSALKFVDARQSGAVAWGAEADGVYVTHDGGGLWKKTALSFDAWLAAPDGALHAVAAEPILQAAALARRHHGLAGAAEMQMKGGGVSGPQLRAALPYPGREALLMGSVADLPVFRSTDGGTSWTRMDRPALALALALRAAVEKGGQDSAHAAPPPAPPPQQQQRARQQNSSRPMRDLGPQAKSGRLDDAPPLPQWTGGGGRGVPRHPANPSAPQGPPPRALSPDTLLAFVDPLRLLSHFNGAAPLSGVSGAAAFAPPQPSWDALVAALVVESESEHEISLGPGRTEGAVFELLRSSDGGSSWSAGPLPPGPPQSIAAGADAVFMVRADGRAWRIAP